MQSSEIYRPPILKSIVSSVSLRIDVSASTSNISSEPFKSKLVITAVKVTTVAVALRPLVSAEPVPNNVYSSKVIVNLVLLGLRVSPVPSFAESQVR